MRASSLVLLVACAASHTSGDGIALPDVRGRIDHMAFDAERSRLFVCALENGTVEVVDVAAGKVVKSLSKLDEPQGAAVIPARKQIAVATGGDGKLHVFDAESLAEVKRLDAGDDADNVRLDAKGERLWVAAGEGLVCFDVAEWKRVATVRLAGHAESFQLERDGARLFANVPSARHVAVVDRAKNEVVATWPLEGASSNFPMALDEKGGRIFVGCRSPAQLLALDAQSGKVVAKAPIGGDCDDLFLDAGRGHLYASCGDGVVSVVTLALDGTLKPAEPIATAAGARTSLYVPALARIFVAAPKRGGSGAELRVVSVGAGEAPRK